MATKDIKIMTEADFRKKIKDSFGGAYLFFGDEDYMKLNDIRLASSLICSEPAFELFNLVKIDATDFSAEALKNAIFTPPMMSDNKLICVTGLDFSEFKTSEIDELCDILSLLPDYDYNTVILCCPADKFDSGYLPKKPSALLSKLSAFMTCVYFEPSTPSQLARWVQKHFEANSVTADPDVCSFTVEHCGRNMFILSSEIDKISYYVLCDPQKNARVTRCDVEEVSTAAMEYDSFAFANAIMDGRHDKALEYLSDMKFKQVKPLYILSEISRVYCDLISVKMLLDDGHSAHEIPSLLKMNEYKAKLYCRSAMSVDMKKLSRAVGLCRDADQALKLSAHGYLPIEKLVCAF